MKNNGFKIWIGPRENSGYAQGLMSGFKKLGVDSAFFELEAHPFRYSIPMDSFLERFSSRFARSKDKNLFTKIIFAFPFLLLKLILFICAIFRYNSFIFLDGKSFFKLLDLPILKMLGKKIIFIYLGSDSRPPYMDGTVPRDVSNRTTHKLRRLSRRQKKRVLFAEKYADSIIDYPSFGHFHEKPFINGFRIGLPKEYSVPNMDSMLENKKAVTILHCPSDPVAKGTAEVRKIVAELKEAGLEFEYLELMDRPHAEIIRAIQRADIIFDQLYSDTPLSAFPAEAAYFEKCSLIGGYYSELYERDIPESERPPSYFVHPSQLKNELKKLVKNSNERYHSGQTLRKFLRENWNPQKIAEIVLSILKGGLTADYYFNPKDIRYFKGACISEAELRQTLRYMLGVYGPESLYLDDKPELKSAILKFAGFVKKEIA